MEQSYTGMAASPYGVVDPFTPMALELRNSVPHPPCPCHQYRPPRPSRSYPLIGSSWDPPEVKLVTIVSAALAEPCRANRAIKPLVASSRRQFPSALPR